MTRRASTLLKAAIVAVLALVAVWLLFTVVFPWVDRQFDDPVLDASLDRPVVLAHNTPFDNS